MSESLDRDLLAVVAVVLGPLAVECILRVDSWAEVSKLKIIESLVGLDELHTRCLLGGSKGSTWSWPWVATATSCGSCQEGKKWKEFAHLGERILRGLCGGPRLRANGLSIYSSVPDLRTVRSHVGMRKRYPDGGSGRWPDRGCCDAPTGTQ